MTQRPYACFVLAFLFLGFSNAFAQHDPLHRVEFGPELSELYLPLDPVGSVNYQASLGALCSLNLHRYFGIDTSLGFTPAPPGTATGFAGGRMLQFSAGLRAGISKGRFGFYGKARPGVVSFGRAILLVDPPPAFRFHFGRLTEPTIDIGGIVEVRVSKKFALRYDAGDTVIRYGSRTVFSNQPAAPSEVTHNFRFSIGFLFLFR